MQVERAVTFNQQVTGTVAGDVSFDWKSRPVDKVDFNAFVPITLLNINLKTLSWYEVLENSIVQLRGEDNIFHATKMKPVTLPPVNHFAEEMGESSDLNHHSFKHLHG
jgi:hypothetical protein